MPAMQLCLVKEPEKVMLQNLMANKADDPVGSFTHDTGAYFLLADELLIM